MGFVKMTKVEGYNSAQLDVAAEDVEIAEYPHFTRVQRTWVRIELLNCGNRVLLLPGQARVLAAALKEAADVAAGAEAGRETDERVKDLEDRRRALDEFALISAQSFQAQALADARALAEFRPVKRRTAKRRTSKRRTSKRGKR